MTLTKLQFFVEAAKRENFTEAAEALFVSQPALSKQVALLEREVGTKLFERLGRGVRLTAAGRHLYRRLKDVPALVAQAVEEAQPPASMMDLPGMADEMRRPMMLLVKAVAR